MIPAFCAAGVIPPFVGDPASLRPRSPYAVSVRDVVERFATSTKRCDILRGWLDHRAAVHSLGIVDGFQWLDGSFCERLIHREPNDIDLVTFDLSNLVEWDLKPCIAHVRVMRWTRAGREHRRFSLRRLESLHLVGSDGPGRGGARGA